MSVGSLGLNREYSSVAAWWLGSMQIMTWLNSLEARLWLQLRWFGSARLKYCAHVAQLTKVVLQAAHVVHPLLRQGWFLHHWVRIEEPYSMEWSKCVLTTSKIWTRLKNSSIFYERSSNTNYWWERPLVVVLKHSGKIKQYVLYHKQQAYINCKLSNPHLLFLSSVSLFYFSHSIA